MQLAEYLMCVAARHYHAKDKYGWELREHKHDKLGDDKYPLTYDNESEMLKSVIGSIRGKPSCLKTMSLQAVTALAYLLKAKLSKFLSTEGHYLIDKIMSDPEQTIVYLNALGELRDLGWIRLVEMPGQSFIDNPPFCWLQAQIELGDTFHREMGANRQYNQSFASNDAYLDAVYAYLQTMIFSNHDQLKVNDDKADISKLQPDGWFRGIALRVESSICTLPAAETLKKYSLSVYQHLALVGLLGMRDGELDYEFGDPAEVSQLFAKGRACQKLMQEHLYGKNSNLMRQRLVEGARGSFGEGVKLTQVGIRALLGKNRYKGTTQELISKVRKNTLFDIEEPKVKRSSVKLPPLVMEALRSLIFSESKKGRQIREQWQASLPTAWGAPTGSTVLLYGPPGTGKTLTAQYLASELKLPLLKIDAARVLSCWVGESEQNVRRIFDDYDDIQQDLERSPVLLLNEADQLLGARDAGSNAVDRMNNNMQNLFLEGLERFSGILVATTNRRDLLDEAFSRRFTYKLELPPPDRALRMELWKSHLPMKRLAKNVDISQLADLGLTGGEIRLVIERTVRLLAYRGMITIDGKTLTDIAREELASRMKRFGSAGRIGFAREDIS
ncbi:MAG: ATP-binding protein [Deltaproteobacteria bacterium]|nr:ATP-binding protein [Deltaproteobacteria bacterium]